MAALRFLWPIWRQAFQVIDSTLSRLVSRYLCDPWHVSDTIHSSVRKWCVVPTGSHVIKNMGVHLQSSFRQQPTLLDSRCNCLERWLRSEMAKGQLGPMRHKFTKSCYFKHKVLYGFEVGLLSKRLAELAYYWAILACQWPCPSTLRTA